MDEETKAAFADISAAFGTINGLLGQIIENMATKTQFDALMKRMDGSREHVADRMLTMVTRQDWVTDRDTILARLENLEAEMTLGFRQLNEKMDRQHAAILDLLKRA